MTIAMLKRSPRLSGDAFRQAQVVTGFAVKHDVARVVFFYAGGALVVVIGVFWN
jgi:hypothetical protein